VQPLVAALGLAWSLAGEPPQKRMADGRIWMTANLDIETTADGVYARGDAHGFYWTASETSAGGAWLYNFGRGRLALNRHRDSDKTTAVSERCIRD
jgi:hypothetical protein